MFSGHGGVGKLGLVRQMNQENGQGPALKAMLKRHGQLRHLVWSSTVNIIEDDGDVDINKGLKRDCLERMNNLAL